MGATVRALLLGELHPPADHFRRHPALPCRQVESLMYGAWSHYGLVESPTEHVLTGDNVAGRVVRVGATGRPKDDCGSWSTWARLAGEVSSR
jgi:hypothetical protein